MVFRWQRFYFVISLRLGPLYELYCDRWLKRQKYPLLTFSQSSLLLNAAAARQHLTALTIEARLGYKLRYQKFEASVCLYSNANTFNVKEIVITGH